MKISGFNFFWSFNIMVFLSINPNNHDDMSKTTNKTLIKQLNDAIGDNKNVFVLFYMEGCGPCNATRPEWNKLKNVLKKYADDENTCIVDIEYTTAEKVSNIKRKPSSFPTIRFLSNKGNSEEDFEDSNVDEKERNVDNFVKWIESKKNTMTGGRNRKYRFRKNKKTNKNKKHTLKRKHTKSRRFNK